MQVSNEDLIRIFNLREGNSLSDWPIMPPEPYDQKRIDKLNDPNAFRYCSR